MTTKNSVAGHRKRLKERFLKSGLVGFHDYEIVELLLIMGTPRRDCKQYAKQLIERFHSLRGVLDASTEELESVHGIGPHNAICIKLVHEVARKFLKGKALDKPVCASAPEVFDYLYHSMRDRKKELFKVLYLDSQNRILEIVDLFEGTVNASAVHPREVMEGALNHNAVSIIFAHNHPSGNPKPSNNDKEATKDLVYAGHIMNIKVLDHIIIGDNNYFSFAAADLIDDYDSDFLNIKLKAIAGKLRAGHPKSMRKR